MSVFSTYLLLSFFLLYSNQLHSQTTDDLSDKNYGVYPLTTAQAPTAAPNQTIYRTPPPAPAAMGDNLCAPGAANLSATASAGGVLNWFTVASGGTAVASGTAYSPTIAGTTNYWVEETVAGGGGGPTSMATPYNSNNGQRGCMFNITATNAITITHFDANLYAGTTANYEIYYRAGTHVGFENNAGAWTLLGSATAVASLGNNVPTPLPINFSVSIPAGQTYSFYVTNDFGAGLSYTDGTAVGNFLASDANLTVYEGVGKSYPFGLTFNVRNFNGTIHYTTGSGPSTSPRTMVTANVKTPSYAPTATTTSSNASCTVNEGGVDWTYYYSSTNPNDLLFAIAHDPNNLGNNNFTASVDVTVNTNSTTTGYYTQSNVGLQLARFVMGRYWNVTLASGNIVDPVWVRYYYQSTEKAAINAAAATWQGNNGGVQSPLYFFKTVGTPFNPATGLHYNGVYNSIELNSYTDNQTAANGTNYVEIHGINSFSGGGLITGVVPVGGTTSADAILLETKILSFAAQQQEEKVQLDWSLEQENEILYYEVEHSLDAIGFSPIGKVLGNGNEGQQHYTWKHQQPFNGMNYYRIKLVALDGAMTYSTIKAVDFKTSKSATIQAGPIPFDEVLTIRLGTALAQGLSIAIVNTLGQTVYREEKALEEGENTISITNTESWNAGCYIVVLKGEQFSKQLTVIKK